MSPGCTSSPYESNNDAFICTLRHRHTALRYHHTAPRHPHSLLPTQSQRTPSVKMRAHRLRSAAVSVCVCRRHALSFLCLFLSVSLSRCLA
eukprot:2114408-Rhodomonas_salina.1